MWGSSTKQGVWVNLQKQGLWGSPSHKLRIIGVLCACFGSKIDGLGLFGGLIIYQGHLFALKGHLSRGCLGAVTCSVLCQHRRRVLRLGRTHSGRVRRFVPGYHVSAVLCICIYIYIDVCVGWGRFSTYIYTYIYTRIHKRCWDETRLIGSWSFHDRWVMCPWVEV